MKRTSLIVTISVLVSLLFVGLRFLPDVGATTLYVGGAGPGNYTTIQAAIDDAGPGNTIYVYGGLYLENVVVDKTLSLAGEGRGITIVDGGGTGDTIQVAADWVNISGFRITNSGSLLIDAGLDLGSNDNCSVYSNRLSGNGLYGVTLSGASNTIIQNNVMSNNVWSVYLGSSNDNIIADNSISEDSEWGTGISIEDSHGNTIKNNTVSGTESGIHMYASSRNTISESTVSGNWRGIYVVASNDNTIAVNNVTQSSDRGIYLDRSHGNAVSLNALSGNRLGVYLENSDDNDILDNVVTSSNQHGIYVFESENNRVLRNNAHSNTGSGIHVYGPGYNTVSGNMVRLNQNAGLHFDTAGGNLISNNTMEENKVGAHFQSTWFNHIHHNSFLNNTVQAYDDSSNNYWDDGYPSGGNYWSNYAGIDNCSGPNQDICPDPDGIGDTPYVIDADSQDNYPLVAPLAELVPKPPVWTQARLSGTDLENITLQWQLSPDDGAAQRPVVEYHIFRNSTYASEGRGYGLIAVLPNGTSSFEDSSKGEGDPNDYFYQVCALNAINKTTCTMDQAGKFTRSLSTGWNPISIPLIQSDESIETVLQTVKYNKAWSYDSLSQEWKWHMKSKEYRRGLWDMNHTTGIWLNVTSDCNLTVAGVVPAQTTIHLYQGWNLVSFPSFNFSYAVHDLKLDTEALRVEGYDSMPPYYLRVLGDADVLQPGEAYWVHVEADADWIVEVS